MQVRMVIAHAQMQSTIPRSMLKLDTVFLALFSSVPCAINEFYSLVLVRPSSQSPLPQQQQPLTPPQQLRQQLQQV